MGCHTIPLACSFQSNHTPSASCTSPVCLSFASRSWSHSLRKFARTGRTSASVFVFVQEVTMPTGTVVATDVVVAELGATLVQIIDAFVNV